MIPDLSYSWPRIDTHDYRTVCFFAACMIYACFGSPTPDHIGIPEFFIGVLLCLSIGIGRLRDALIAPARTRFWKSAAQLLFFYGLIVTTIISAMRGAEIADMLRDFIPFLFLFLPLFLLPLLRAKPYYYRSALFAVVLIGFIFSVRSLLMRNSSTCSIWCTDELLYLENMPSVLFCALLLIGRAAQGILRKATPAHLLQFFALMLLALFPLASMAVTLQRASLGAVVAYTALITAYGFYKNPYRGAVLLCAFAVFSLWLQISFGAAFQALWQKTENVGLNMRPQEFASVWTIVTQDPLTFLFGLGWGSDFHSPAVGNLRVSFTHNFFTSMILKTGFFGLVLSIAYIAGLLERLSRVILKNHILGFALCAPILIDLTLYASFKSLDFGVVLLLISGSLVYFRYSESNDTGTMLKTGYAQT